MGEAPSSAELLVRNDLRFIEFARDLSESDWGRSSLCDGWSNSDVLAHMVVGCTASFGSVARAMVAKRGSFDGANTSMSTSLSAGVTAGDLLDQYAEASVGRTGIGRAFPKSLLLGDHVLHEMDIALGLGRIPQIDADVLQAVLTTEVSIRNPFVPAKRTAAGLHLVADDVNWERKGARGDAAYVSGPAWALASVLANRSYGLSNLTGTGVDILSRRLTANGHPQANNRSTP